MNCFFKSLNKGFNSDYYEVKTLEKSTRHFKKIDYVFRKDGPRKGRLLVTCASEPHENNGIPPDTLLIKFENDLLYQERFDWEVKEFLSLNNLGMRNITRLDIATDFNNFPSRHSPRALIESFVQKKILKLGRCKFKQVGELKAGRENVIENILDEFDFPDMETKKEFTYSQIQQILNKKIQKIYTGKDFTSYSINGEVTHSLEYDYLRFGQQNSIVSTKLYDKCKEMRQVKMKPWIVEQWKAVGLNFNFENPELVPSETVWRLEISYKGSTKALKNIHTEKKIGFNTLDILEKENIEELFKSGIEKYFKFCKNSLTRNKSRMQKIDLFKFGELTHTVIDYTSKKESSRADKIFINKLEKTNRELVGTADDISEMCSDVKQYFIYSRGLDLNNQKPHSNAIITETPNSNIQFVAETEAELIEVEKIKEEFIQGKLFNKDAA